MTLEPFDLYTPGVRRLYHFEFHNDEPLLGAEVRRTLDALAAAAPARIAKGPLTEAEARAEAALWLAIAQDLEAQGQWNADGRGSAGWSLSVKLRELRAAGGVAWTAKVAALRGEIAARRSGYPTDVAKGRLTSDLAKQQLERLEAVHDLYWRHGFAFDGTRDQLMEHGNAIMDASIARYGPAKVPSNACSDTAVAELEQLDKDADQRRTAA